MHSILTHFESVIIAEPLVLGPNLSDGTSNSWFPALVLHKSHVSSFRPKGKGEMLQNTMLQLTV